MSSVLTRDGKFLRTTDGKGLNFDSLITQANAKTGANDKTLGAAVQRLMDGYNPTGVLPDEYQEVEWIQGDGSTGYIPLLESIPNPSYFIEIEANGDEYIGSSTFAVLAGVRTSGIAPARYFSIQNITNNIRFYLEKEANYTDAEKLNGFFTIKADYSGLYINGIKHSIDSSTWVQAAPIAIFARSIWNSGAAITYEGYSKYKIRRLSDTRGSYAVCYRKSDTKIGVYNLTRGTFYPSYGTLYKGPDVISPTDFMNNLEAIL